jgi:hypothetical protein
MNLVVFTRVWKGEPKNLTKKNSKNTTKFIINFLKVKNNLISKVVGLIINNDKSKTMFKTRCLSR